MTSNNGLNLGATHGTVPKYRLFSQQPAGGATPTNAPAYAGDSLQVNPVGGNGDYQTLLQQTDAMMQSADVTQRYRAIVNMTKMQPADAIPRLQAAAAMAGQDPQVVSLANQAIQAMQRQAAAPQTQPPTGNQPQQPATQQPAPNYGTYTPPTPTAYNPGVAMGPLSPEDAAMTLQMLQSDLGRGGDPVVLAAIPQLMALQAANPSMKESVFNLLLNHVYHNIGPSVDEAVKALGSMNDPRAIPYLQEVARRPYISAETRQFVDSLVAAQANQASGTPGVASANGISSVAYIRSIEAKLNGDPLKGQEALAQLRQSLGANPTAPSEARTEINRVLITYIATQISSGTLVGASQMLGEMKSRESLQYLDALARTPGISDDARTAARNAMRQIMQP